MILPGAINKIQQKCGALTYYRVGVYLTMLVAIGSISSSKSKATYHTYDVLEWSMDYFASKPNASIFYHSSDMVLHAHSDSSNLPKFKALNSPYQKHARREKIIFLQGGKIPYEHV